ncbi:MAG: hypothetical protein HYY31_05445, partial [Chloroflexi bacterium]|nr:hypothetical protein [Chloroflexota bacterium]
MNYLWQETPPRPLRVIEEALEKALFQNAFLKRLITLFRRALGFYHQKGFTLLELAVMLGVTTMISFPLAAITYQFM